MIRRTIHVTKHVKPKHPVGAGAGGSYAGGAGSSGGSATTGASSTGSSSLYYVGSGDHLFQRRLGGGPELTLGAGRDPHQRLSSRRGSGRAAAAPRS